MPYFRIERAGIGFGKEYEIHGLVPGDKVKGKVNRGEVSLEIVDDDTATYNSVVVEGEQGSVIFDKEDKLPKRERGIVYLDQRLTQELILLAFEFRDRVPGAFQDSLTSLWKRMEVQVGRGVLRQSFGRRLLAVMSAGRSEDFTKDL